MKKRILLSILFINILNLMLMASVFAWFTIKSGSELEYNAYFNSRRLIEAQTISSMTDQNERIILDYNNNLIFDKVTNAFKTDEYFKNSRYSGPLTVDLNIRPYANINFRVFIFHQWTNDNNELINALFEPIVNYNNNDFTYDASTGAYNYNHILYKNDDSSIIRLVNDITLPTGASFGNNHLKTSIYIEAKQANSVDEWQNNSFEISGPIESLEIAFEKLTNPYYLRGVGVRITHGDNSNNTRTYIFNSNNRNQIISGIGNANNPHKVTIFLPRTIDFDLELSSTKLSITSKYQAVSEFVGIHDFVYSPTVIRVYNYQDPYRKGDIVLYQGTYYIALQDGDGGWNGAINAGHVWMPLGNIYRSGTLYPINSVVYDLETEAYYINLANWSSDITSAQWKRVGLNYAKWITYFKGDLVTYDIMENDVLVRKTFYSVANNHAHQVPGSAKHAWKLYENNINFTDGYLYFAGEYTYVASNNNYYRSTSTNGYVGNLPGTTNGWVLLTNKTWTSNTIFNNNDMTIYNGREYAWIGQTSANNTPIPGTSTSWEAMDRNWHEYNTYEVGDAVYYNGGIYSFNGTGPNQGLEPGSGPGWTLFTIDWFAYNIYEYNDVVIHNGSVWRALIDNATAPPGQDFTHWEEIRLEWLPDRDIPPLLLG